MKHAAATIFALLILMCANPGTGTTAGSGSSILWHSYDQGLELAKEQNKMMMIDFTSEWCSWCDKLDEDTYSDPSVIGLAGDFVAVKVDVDENKAIADKFQIEGLPTVVFASSGEVEIHRVVGYESSDGFKADMNLALQKSAGTDASATDADAAEPSPGSGIPGFGAAVTSAGMIIASLLIRRRYG